MTDRSKPLDVSAYGGPGWRPRTQSIGEETGTIWGNFGIATEWTRLKAVLLHRPGSELTASTNPNEVQMLAPLDLTLAQAQFAQMAQAYESAGVTVHLLDPAITPSPNQMFMADLMFMTPEGAILARPASEVRAGEERRAAIRLAALGIPIARSIGGRGTFEGADAMWLDPQTVILGRGLRTNDAGAAQVTATLQQMGVDVIQVDLPVGSMHLMGMLRIADRDLAIGYPTRLAHRAADALRERGYHVAYPPNIEEELRGGSPLNFVTIGPREILMAAGNPNTQAFFEDLGIECHTIPVDELSKAAGAMGCMTAILQRAAV